ncbi:transthyretin-like protein [Cercophora newfieldiana]|uniref:5-hydroxyisourate hydrolase n=1 Tax=Cercophora newfieldiana TaxID=92897 RepID=A0AA39YHZ4_9PEZI|nr:transthyretin-like protein [Cercophora newfieldiana]
MAAEKDQITCHVLDTREGKPAKGIRVKLELSAPTTTSPHHGVTPASRIFESQTDDDGRIKVWLPYSSETSSGEVPVYTLDDVMGGVEAAATNGTSRWTLRFDTAGYFGEENTFFPEVTVVFTVKKGQHYHVPVLLSPYSYTTYRGS